MRPAEFGCSRVPAPQAVCRGQPEIAPAILIRWSTPKPKLAVATITLNIATLNGAQFCRTGGCLHSGGPQHTLPIFVKRVNVSSGEIRILCQLAVLPAHESRRGAKPKSPVPRSHDASNIVARQMLAAGGCQATVRTPSKRTSPDSVASQRYPSGVCAIWWIVPATKPSRIFHAVCAYWLTSSDGSSANAVRPQIRAAHAKRSTRMGTADCALHLALIGQ